MSTNSSPSVDEANKGATEASSTGSQEGDFVKTLLHVAWLSITFGVALELLLLLVATYSGTFQSIKPFIADCVQKITWSFFVCIGLAIGTTAAKLKAPVMGILGFISAPAGFYLARALHKGATQALSLAGAAVVGPAPLLIASIKAVQYATLGWLIGQFTKEEIRLSRYIRVGLLVGLSYGFSIVTLFAFAPINPISSVQIISRIINEVLFPVGCSLILYSADAVSKRAK